MQRNPPAKKRPEWMRLAIWLTLWVPLALIVPIGLAVGLERWFGFAPIGSICGLLLGVTIATVFVFITVRGRYRQFAPTQSREDLDKEPR